MDFFLFFGFFWVNKPSGKPLKHIKVVYTLKWLTPSSIPIILLSMFSMVPPERWKIALGFSDWLAYKAKWWVSFNQVWFMLRLPGNKTDFRLLSGNSGSSTRSKMSLYDARKAVSPNNPQYLYRHCRPLHTGLWSALLFCTIRPATHSAKKKKIKSENNQKNNSKSDGNHFHRFPDYPEKFMNHKECWIQLFGWLLALLEEKYFSIWEKLQPFAQKITDGFKWFSSNSNRNSWKFFRTLDI